MPDLLHHLHHYPFPLLVSLYVRCYFDSDVCGLTAFLPQSLNLRTLNYVREHSVSESVEKRMWETAVRRCRNLEVVRVEGTCSDVSCQRLVSVLRNLSEWDGIQALKLRRVVRVHWSGKAEEEYTKQVKHLLPALQHNHCCLL